MPPDVNKWSNRTEELSSLSPHVYTMIIGPKVSVYINSMFTQQKTVNLYIVH